MRVDAGRNLSGPKAHWREEDVLSFTSALWTSLSIIAATATGYTVRTTSDAHFGVGVDRGDDRWETGGFIVHFFDRARIDRLAGGFEILEVADFEEGRLPRRLVAVTMRKH